MEIHLVFDLLAAISSFSVTYVVYRWRLAPAVERIEQAGPGYAAALLAGAVIGGYGFGSLNLWLGGEFVVARSVAGALAGAILTIEIYKHWNGIEGSTGLIFVPAFCTSIAIGRIGCFLSGLDDRTYGTPTSLPWGFDFGDGILRHPVQLYESLAMTVFLAITLIEIGRRNLFFQRNGFYLMTMFYACQRFAWEFLKPYAAVIGPFNIFHLVCAGLAIYAGIMMLSQGRLQTLPDREPMPR